MLKFITSLFATLNPANNSSFIEGQLKHPNGLFASKVANGMNVSNKGLYDLVFENLSLKENEHVLEIGFGNGFFFEELIKKNNSVKLYGIEISKEMISECEKINKQLIADNKLEVVYVFDSTIPYHNQSFNKIIAINLIYFLENPKDYLKEVNRVLKQNGELFIGIRPSEVLSQLPFAKNSFNIQKDNWWVALIESMGFSLIHNSYSAEPPLYFNGIAYEMSGIGWVFKKVN